MQYAFIVTYGSPGFSFTVLSRQELVFSKKEVFCRWQHIGIIVKKRKDYIRLILNQMFGYELVWDHFFHAVMSILIFPACCSTFLTKGCFWGSQNNANKNCHRDRRTMVRRKVAWSGPGLCWQTPGMGKAGDPSDQNVFFASPAHWKCLHFWDLWGKALKVHVLRHISSNNLGMKGHLPLNIFIDM